MKTDYVCEMYLWVLGASGEEGERQPAAEQIPMTSTRLVVCSEYI